MNSIYEEDIGTPILTGELFTEAKIGMKSKGDSLKENAHIESGTVRKMTLD